MALQAKTREKLRKKKVVYMGEFKIGKKGEGKRKLYASVSELAAQKLGLEVTDAQQVNKDSVSYLVDGGKAKTVQIRLTKSAAENGGASRTRTTTIRVPSYAGTFIVAEFLLKQARTKVTSFKMKSRGKSYPLSLFESSGSSGSGGGSTP